jgi:hypothetical protein
MALMVPEHPNALRLFEVSRNSGISKNSARARSINIFCGMATDQPFNIHPGAPNIRHCSKMPEGVID